MKIHIPTMDSYGVPEEDDSFCEDPTPTPPISPVRGEGDEDGESSFSDDTLTIDSSSEIRTTWGKSAESEDCCSTTTIDSLASLRKTSKSGKRVTFPEDEYLVRVFFIPVDCGPSMEELRPCDPESLVERVTDLSIEALSPLATQMKPGSKQGTASKAFDVSSLRVGNGFIVNPIASAQFGPASNNTLGRGLCIQGRPSPTIPKPAPRKKANSSFLMATRSDANAKDNDKQNTGSSKSGGDNQRRFSITDKSVSKNEGLTIDSKFTSQESPRKGMAKSASTSSGRQRTALSTNEQKLDTTIRHAQRKVKSASWSSRRSRENGPHLFGQRLQGVNPRQNVLQRLKSASMDDLKPANLARSRSLSCDNLKTNLSISNSRLSPTPLLSHNKNAKGLLGLRSSSANRSLRKSSPSRPVQNPSEVSNEILKELPPPLPRIHASPYRQSSLPSLGQRSVTFVDPGGCRDRSDSARSDLSSSGGRVHVMKQASTPSETRKLYAWHMANGTLGKNAHLETPSISPMLDFLPKAASETPVPT